MSKQVKSFDEKKDELVKLFKEKGCITQDKFLNVVKELGITDVKDIEKLRDYLSENKIEIVSNKNEYKVGEIFGVYSYCVRTPEFNFPTDYTIKFSTLAGKEVLLVKYIGDNKFQEYYSGVTINLVEDTTIKFEDKISYYDQCLKFIENPLCIVKGELMEFNDKLILEFSKNIGNEEKEMRGMLNANKRISELLQSRMNSFISRDYDEAYYDNCVFDFSRGKTYASKTLSLKKDN